MDSIVTEFNDTGICRIDTETAVKKWNKLWQISQYKEKFTLVKYKRKDSPITTLKVLISKEQAMILSDRLGLIRECSSVFNSGATWKLPNSGELN